MQEGEEFVRMNCDFNDSLWLDWSYKKYQCHNVRWVVKLKSKSIKAFGMESKSRICEKRLVECIGRKYQQIEVYSNR